MQCGACLDTTINGFWDRQSERAFVDVRVFNPYANSNLSTTSCGKKHENIKKRAYEQRLLCLFHTTPTGGMAPETMVFYKKLASQLE